ncbi:BLOC-1-related complex subunit 8 homolog isoform X2 [Lineus longissimus]|uniref:BLOC-1-related complex subunit 8 homolog isoform X2 n=1 Tax=Lineus longissimus TaxID=88925 RepID=UPI00315D54DE
MVIQNKTNLKCATNRIVSKKFQVGFSQPVGTMFHDLTAAVGAQLFSENANPELDHKVKKVTEKFSENLHIVANEPSLAFYRIQEHVRKSMPQLVEQRHEVEDLHQQVQGSCFDMEYAAGAVRTMNQSRAHFQNIQDLLKNSMFMKQQIEYENNRRMQERTNPSMYRSLLRQQKTFDHAAVGINNSDQDEVFTSSDQPSRFSPKRLTSKKRSQSMDSPSKKK